MTPSETSGAAPEPATAACVPPGAAAGAVGELVDAAAEPLLAAAGLAVAGLGLALGGADAGAALALAAVPVARGPLATAGVFSGVLGPLAPLMGAGSATAPAEDPVLLGLGTALACAAAGVVGRSS
jgi:hypothetical protein